MPLFKKTVPAAPKPAPAPPTLEERLELAQSRAENGAGTVRTGAAILAGAASDLQIVRDEASAEIERLAVLATTASQHAAQANKVSSAALSLAE